MATFFFFGGGGGGGGGGRRGYTIFFGVLYNESF